MTRYCIIHMVGYAIERYKRGRGGLKNGNIGATEWMNVSI